MNKVNRTHGNRVLFKELRSAGQLQHNIIPVYSLAVQDGQLYFSMKKVEGITLHMMSSKKLSEERNNRPLHKKQITSNLSNGLHGSCVYPFSESVIHAI